MAKTEPDVTTKPTSRTVVDDIAPDPKADKPADAESAKAAAAVADAKAVLDKAKADFDKAQADYDAAEAARKATPPTAAEPYVLVDDGLGNLATLACTADEVKSPVLLHGGATYRHKDTTADGRWIFRVD